PLGRPASGKRRPPPGARACPTIRPSRPPRRGPPPAQNPLARRPPRRTKEALAVAPATTRRGERRPGKPSDVAEACYKSTDVVANENSSAESCRSHPLVSHDPAVFKSHDSLDVLQQPRVVGRKQERNAPLGEFVPLPAADRLQAMQVRAKDQHQRRVGDEPVVAQLRQPLLALRVLHGDD